MIKLDTHTRISQHFWWFLLFSSIKMASKQRNCVQKWANYEPCLSPSVFLQLGAVIQTAIMDKCPKSKLSIWLRAQTFNLIQFDLIWIRHLILFPWAGIQTASHRHRINGTSVQDHSFQYGSDIWFNFILFGSDIWFDWIWFNLHQTFNIVSMCLQLGAGIQTASHGHRINGTSVPRSKLSIWIRRLV